MISILLAAYNGEQYIKAQIESILHQTVQDFVLYVNDDCSEDRTWEILKDYADQYPGKIVRDHIFDTRIRRAFNVTGCDHIP